MAPRIGGAHDLLEAAVAKQRIAKPVVPEMPRRTAFDVAMAKLREGEFLNLDDALLDGTDIHRLRCSRCHTSCSGTIGAIYKNERYRLCPMNPKVQGAVRNSLTPEPED